jgi:hypothetical protein
VAGTEALVAVAAPEVPTGDGAGVVLPGAVAGDADAGAVVGGAGAVDRGAGAGAGRDASGDVRLDWAASGGAMQPAIAIAQRSERGLIVMSWSFNFVRWKIATTRDRRAS